MPRIQCMLGPQSDVYVGSTPYNFVLDAYGRAVADVDDRLHVQCFISLEHYRLVPDDLILGETAAPPPSLNDTDDIDDTDDDDDDANGTGTDNDAPEGDQDGKKGDETPPPTGEPGEQPKVPEGEGVKEAPKPEKKRAGRPKKADAAKPNAE